MLIETMKTHEYTNYDFGIIEKMEANPEDALGIVIDAIREMNDSIDPEMRAYPKMYASAVTNANDTVIDYGLPGDDAFSVYVYTKALVATFDSMIDEFRIYDEN